MRAATVQSGSENEPVNYGKWQRWLGGSDWPDLLGLVSPKLFDVISAGAMARQAAELARNYLDPASFARTRGLVSERLSRSGLGITLRDPWTSPGPGGWDRPEAVLRLYFYQLFSGGEALLDLRRRSFSRQRGALVWDPNPLYVQWHPAFLRQIRALYSGFYDADDRKYRTALEDLGIFPAEALFREHFGGNHTRATRFAVENFRRTFHRAFALCQQAKTQLHPNFVPLGICLAGLYRHLEQMGGAYDVLTAFNDARARARATPESTQNGS